MESAGLPGPWDFSQYPNATPGPSNLAVNCDYNTNGDGDIPIPIDPQLSAFAPPEAQNPLFSLNGVEEQDYEEPHELQRLASAPLPWARDTQGPQGDPFAPPPVPVGHFNATPDSVIPPSPKVRKRKKKETATAQKVMMEGEEDVTPYFGPGVKWCDVCKKDEPPVSQPEGWPFYTCTDCGNSAHPTCLKATHLVPFMTTYNWRCMVCKVCDKCQEKEPEDAIIICDNCDRGWHSMTCHSPPCEIEDLNPDEPWYCQMCPHPTRSYPTDTESTGAPNGITTNRKKKGNRRGGGTLKGKERESDFNLQHEIDVVGDTPQPRSRFYGRRGASRKSSGPPPAKRARLNNNHSPLRPLAAQTPIRIKLKMPPSSPGKENAELEEDFFADVLDVEQRSTIKTAIKEEDKLRFDRSRVIAEANLMPQKHMDDSLQIGPSGRPLRSVATNRPTPPNFPGPGSKSPAPQATSAPHPPPSTHHLRIQHIRFGEHEIDTWYDAPFPEEYANIPDGCLWICEFCLKYMKSGFGAGRHKLKCKAKHPPGDEIYRDGAISVFEVDGRKNKIYCQNLCLLSKMFLDHKSLFYDVEPFLFYVITETDNFGARFVGYFSKEKWSANHYNLSCIMTLPMRQRKGWGNMLIDFSYLLSKKEKRMGSPEKPLSALGAIGYRKYWTLALMRYLKDAPDRIRLEDICAGTSMTQEDVYATLQQQGMITVRDTSLPIRPSPGLATKLNPKGRRQGVARRHLHRQKTQEKGGIPAGPFKPPDKYRIHWDRTLVDAYLSNWEGKGYIQVKADKLRWSPFLATRTNRPVGEEQTDSTHLIANLRISSSDDEDCDPMDVDDAEEVDDDGGSRFSHLSLSSPQSFQEEGEHDSSSDDQSHHQTPTRSRRRRSTKPSNTPNPTFLRRTRSGRILRPTVHSEEEMEMEMEPPPTRRSRRLVIESSEADEGSVRESATPSVSGSGRFSQTQEKEEVPETSSPRESQDWPETSEVLGMLGLPSARGTGTVTPGRETPDRTSAAGRSSVPPLQPSRSSSPQIVPATESPQERTLSPSSPIQGPEMSLSPTYDHGEGVKEEPEQDYHFTSRTSPGRKSMAPSDDTVFAVADPKEMLMVQDDEDADAEGEPDSDWEREQGAV